MVNNIKELLNKKVGKNVDFVVNEGRSRKIRYTGTLLNLYSNIFTIKVDEKVLSYSYSDVITKKIIFN